MQSEGEAGTGYSPPTSTAVTLACDESSRLLYHSHGSVLLCRYSVMLEESKRISWKEKVILIPLSLLK